ncbi:MAG: trehalose-phosphatase [Bacteroidota bacterium]
MKNTDYKAVILDMDGVVTNTATLHFQAWKDMFDKFLQSKKDADFKSLQQKDYNTYLDGVGRFEGIRRFLKSKDITIPEGTQDDDENSDTIYGLGKRKNRIFHELLDKKGVKVYQDARDMIAAWHRMEIPVALISASRNCKKILEAADLQETFDVIVDGETAEKENLRAKPEPDIFIAAAKRMNTEPENIQLVEDAVAGVKAGVNGNFGRVVGIARNDDAGNLQEAGADLVVNTLADLSEILNWPKDLPSALKNTKKIEETIRRKTPFLCLDYDGTLTPIVSNPQDAQLSDEAGKILKDLSEQIKVAIISGRDRADLKSLVEIDTVYYAGSHGFDISGPNNLQLEYGPGKEAQPDLSKAADNLKNQLAEIKGAVVERKKYAIAVHYRNVKQDKHKLVVDAVRKEVKKHTKLKISEGKMIRELKPDIDWHKGQALNWLENKIMQKNKKTIPFYLGDDITDEDALWEVYNKHGVGIITGNPDRLTAATYHLDNTDQVHDFLAWLKKYLGSTNTKFRS